MHRSQLLVKAPPAEIRSNFASLEEAIIARIQEIDKELVDDTFKR
jgi:hypothetical protein